MRPQPKIHYNKRSHDNVYFSAQTYVLVGHKAKFLGCRASSMTSFIRPFDFLSRLQLGNLTYPCTYRSLLTNHELRYNSLCDAVSFLTSYPHIPRIAWTLHHLPHTSLWQKAKLVRQESVQDLRFMAYIPRGEPKSRMYIVGPLHRLRCFYHFKRKIHIPNTRQCLDTSHDDRDDDKNDQQIAIANS